MAREIVRTMTAREDVKDFIYASHQSILLPASSILIGTGNSLNDAIMYTASDLTFSFANGTGDNGLDGGGELNNQWYALYAVPKAGSTTEYVLKASVNPPPQAGGAGPSGYSKYRYLGLFKNGGNGYDATNNSYGIGDIARFVKTGNLMMWQTFNSTNGGLYPAAAGTQALNTFIANTSTNGVEFDWNNLTNFGFANGVGAGGGVKIPYRFAAYLWTHTVNSTAESYIRVTDNVPNDRLYIDVPAIISLSTGEFWWQFNQGDTAIASQFRSEVNGNPNISRFLGIRGMIDPYIMGDKA